MKVTVVLDSKGEVVGFTPGPATGLLAGFGTEAPHGGLLAGPGQEIKEIDVPEEMVSISDFPKLHEHLRHHTKK